MEQQRTQETHANQDKQFNDEIAKVAEQFGVDLSQADEQGQSLEWRVLAHMQKMGLDGSKPGHFAMAFKDYNFDNLVGRQKEQAMEKHAKSQAELKKAGIREVSRTPKSPDGFNGWRPGMNEQQLMNEALQYAQQYKKA